MGFAGLLSFMLIYSGVLMAGDPGQDEAGGYQATLPVVNVAIASKTAKSVTINIGDRYNVSQQTIIVGTDGRQVSIRNMLVPCDAELTYSDDAGSNYPLAQLIRIKSIGSNPTWKYEGTRAK
jgi:hypothetical protein